MDKSKPLSDFLSLVQQDGRIGSTHIAIYVALWKYRLNEGFANPIQVFSRDIMRIAKISWRNTFYNCVNDLDRYGYITYEPSIIKK
ncbi:hypothetical protein LJ707_10375 [Mucilaginibacter sp. UR6-1]|uniref:hypothetical protein n=1 Tax=Mucilaginibacter sp. UR6-1 TaxID=1435643 RepID=UPI001E29B39C|nr:hypothetical protein [Mucilaginibacter sp. UR6-1]MCC8409338.1 hypothetical protein [Mucilaginibacter sp. UR6-1]